ncbi:DUF397 domain-containing protein [Streptomyces sp. NPDC049627]|uniref:DUF397 domain-containing protein n=1 Tax=Streptomyces sp. NPDC049627 TaxID=3365595 RepID=UPI0037B7A0EC
MKAHGDVESLNGGTVDGSLEWRKSSHSATAQTCVEIAQASLGVWIRDSKDVTMSPLHASANAWQCFLKDVAVSHQIH